MTQDTTKERHSSAPIGAFVLEKKNRRVPSVVTTSSTNQQSKDDSNQQPPVQSLLPNQTQDNSSTSDANSGAVSESSIDVTSKQVSKGTTSTALSTIAQFDSSTKNTNRSNELEYENDLVPHVVVDVANDVNGIAKRSMYEHNNMEREQNIANVSDINRGSGSNRVAEAVPEYIHASWVEISAMPISTDSISSLDRSVSDSVEQIALDRAKMAKTRNDLKDELYQYTREEPLMFDWIQAALGDGVWYNCMDPYVVWYSPAFMELFGYDADDDFAPNWWMENIFPEDLVKAYAAYTAHLENGAEYDIIVRYRHKDRSTVWVRCHGKAVFDEDGNPIRMLGVHNDLTALMKVQEQLKEKEAVLDLLTSTSLDGYWDWNLVTGELHLSSRFKAILGYADDELSNRIETWWSLLLPEDIPKVLDAIEKCKSEEDGVEQSQGPLLNIVLRYRRKNGTIARMLTQGVAQSITVGSSSTSSESAEQSRKWVRMFGTHTDVSYLEEARAARDASAAKTAFLATMSHEIRTPLNAVLGMAQVLMTTELTEEQKDCVETLHNSGAHLLSLINDILDFSQIESGVITLANENVDIQRTVRDVLGVLQHSAEKKGVLMTFQTTVPAGTHFFCDSERVGQIVFNLVGNAVKFTSEGSICISVETTSACKNSNTNSTETDNGKGLSTEVREDGINIIVKDTGCGIAVDQIEHIFDDFRQAGHEIRSKYGGSGLGLSISKKLIEAMGGHIGVESVCGQGSVFKVWLPGSLVIMTAAETLTRSICSGEIVLKDMAYTSDDLNPTNDDNNVNNNISVGDPDSLKGGITNCEASNENENENRSNKEGEEMNGKDDPDQIGVTNSNIIDTNRTASAIVGCEKRSDTKQLDKDEGPSIYLYEELIDKDGTGSVEFALLGAGVIVERVYDINDAITKISTVKNSIVTESKFTSNTLQPPTCVVVVHQQYLKSTPTQSFQSFVSTMVDFAAKHNDFPTPRSKNQSISLIHIIEVGRRPSSCIDDRNKHIYTNIHPFPTSDEFQYTISGIGVVRNSVRRTPCGSPSLQLPNEGTRTPSLESNATKELRSNSINTLYKTSTFTQPNTTNTAINETKTLKILLAEDNLINQKVMRQMLSRFPCEMEIANNGVEAVGMSKKKAYDLIFMDLIMPEMDGLCASQSIRETNQITPIVALTANATTDDRNDCFAAGMNDFVTKPVSMEALRKIFHKVNCNIPWSNPIMESK